MRVRGGTKRILKRRRVGYGKRRGRVSRPRWLRKYAKLTAPLHIKGQYTTNLTKAGTNVQNKCSWDCFGLWYRQSVIVDILYNRASQRELQSVTIPSMAGPFPTPATAVNVGLEGTALAQNVYAPTYASDSYHLNQTKLMVDKVKHWFQIKNQCNKRVDVQLYFVRPRRDVPAAWEAGGSMTGTDPVWLQRLFSPAHQPPLLVGANGAFLTDDRLQPYEEHNADLFMSDVPKFFKIKKSRRLFLEPGGWKKFKFRRNRNSYFNKTSDGVDASARYDLTWQWMRKFGPLVLVRAQGSQVQDSAAAIATLPNTTNAAIPMTMSGYNVQLFHEYDHYIRGIGQNMSKLKHAMISAALPSNINIANERNFEPQQEQNDNMDIG